MVIVCVGACLCVCVSVYRQECVCVAVPAHETSSYPKGLTWVFVLSQFSLRVRLQAMPNPLNHGHLLGFLLPHQTVNAW